MITLVIGIGNAWRGDDGAGPAAVERFVADGVPAGTRVMSVHQLTPELSEVVAEVDHVIFVDAALGVAAGDVTTREVVADPESRPTTHHLEPSALVALAGRLFGRAPRATLIGIGIEAVDGPDVLSVTVRAAVDDVAVRLRHLVDGA